MIFLVTSRESYADYVALHTDSPLWLPSGLLTDSEIVSLRTQGRSVTVVAHDVSLVDQETLADVLATIREHHPRQSVWVDLSPRAAG